MSGPAASRDRPKRASGRSPGATPSARIAGVLDRAPLTHGPEHENRDDRHAARAEQRPGQRAQAGERGAVAVALQVRHGPADQAAARAGHHDGHEGEDAGAGRGQGRGHHRRGRRGRGTARASRVVDHRRIVGVDPTVRIVTGGRPGTSWLVQSPVVSALVVLPTYEEAENISDVLHQIRAAAPDVEILVVDDGSPDGTADLAEEAARSLGQVSVLRRAAKSGLGPAYRAGFGWGLERHHEILLEMDADLSHDPLALPALLQAVADGADLAIGSRYVRGGAVPGWPASRRLLSRWGNRYVALMLRMRVRDATAGFRAYRSDMVRKIGLDEIRADGYGFQIEMAYAVEQAGGRIVEVPITFRDRVRGTSKMSPNIVGEALWLVTKWGIRDRRARWRHR